MMAVILDNPKGRPAFTRGYSERVREQRGAARAGLQSKPAEEER